MPKMLENVGSNNESQRNDWQRNHLAIQLCISETLTKEKRMPTLLEMSVATGLHEETIRRHSKSLDMRGLRDRSRLLAEEVFVKQALRARATGDHNEAKTYFKLNFGWKETSDINVSGNIEHSHVIGKRLSDMSVEELTLIQQNPECYKELPDGTIIDAEFIEEKSDDI